MTLRTGLFDLDGTLTDPELGITNCIAFALRELGAPVPPQAELRGWIGAPLQATFADFLGSDSLSEDALALYRSRFTDTGLFENTPYAGIHETLAALRPTFESFLVVTSKPTVFARRIIEHFDLDRFFDEVYGSELDGRFTNKVDLMGHVIETRQLQPPSAVMVGDRRFDVQAARQHGVRAVGVLWGFGDREELETAGADAICKTVTDLPATIAGLAD